jgi:hypothetical protein
MVIEGKTKMPFNNGELPSIKSILKNLIDALNRFLIVILLILIIITIFIRLFILDLLKFIILGIILFRLFSKNKIQREKENKQFLKIVNILTKPFTTIKRNLKDRKNHVYKKCSKCKTILKLPLPNKRGINHAKCPNCQKRITLFTLRKKAKEKIKVEVIKKKK